MKSTVDRPTADEIAEMADSGQDIARYFTNQGTVKQPLTGISGDVAQDRGEGRPPGVPIQAAAMGVSRKADTKSCLRQALDQRLSAKRC
ncbi:MAG: hypothetical protein OXF54_22835 [Caldilineaceae bacterium]|nr:hypothetical protein [Caldilineaceae bacterium]